MKGMKKRPSMYKQQLNNAKTRRSFFAGSSLNSRIQKFPNKCHFYDGINEIEEVETPLSLSSNNESKTSSKSEY